MLSHVRVSQLGNLYLSAITGTASSTSVTERRLLSRLAEERRHELPTDYHL